MAKFYEFALVTKGLDPEDEAFEDRLINAGCDDATISFQRGLIILDFARRAPTMEAALMSAIDAAKRGGVKVRGIEPSDRVSMSDISRRANMTRSAISNYFAGVRASGFPLPIDRVTTDSPIWSWAAVAAWLHQQERVDAATVDAAKLIKALNEQLAPEADQVIQERLAAAAA